MNGVKKGILISALVVGAHLGVAHAADAQPAKRTADTKESPAHFSDPAKLLSADASWVQRWAGKLDEFERATGIKVLVEFHPKSPPPEEDKVPGAYMHALSTKFGIDRSGVLAVYFADEDDWRLWIGDELTPHFVGHPGTVKELTDSKAIHDTKEALFAETWAKSDAALAAPQKTPTPVDRLRVRTEMLLDGLMARLRTKK